MINDYKNYTEVAAVSYERFEEVRFILNDWTYDAYVDGREDSEDMRMILNVIESIAIIVINDCVTAMYEGLPGPQARMRELSGYLQDIKDTIARANKTFDIIDSTRLPKDIVRGMVADRIDELTTCFDKAIALLHEDGKIKD